MLRVSGGELRDQPPHHEHDDCPSDHQQLGELPLVSTSRYVSYDSSRCSLRPIGGRGYVLPLALLGPRVDLLIDPIVRDEAASAALRAARESLHQTTQIGRSTRLGHGHDARDDNRTAAGP